MQSRYYLYNKSCYSYIKLYNFYFVIVGALVANLTILKKQQQEDPGFVEYIITNSEANDKFTISDTGLLHTKVRISLWYSNSISNIVKG